MADITIDGRVKVYHVPTIANIAAPTTAELNAGTRIDNVLVADGLIGFAPETADVDNSALSSTFDTVKAGRASYSGTALRLKKQGGADALYNTLVYGFLTHVVIRRNGSLATDAWASANAVEVYPVECGQVANEDYEKNSVQKYKVPVKIRDEPNLRAVVA